MKTINWNLIHDPLFISFFKLGIWSPILFKFISMNNILPINIIFNIGICNV